MDEAERKSKYNYDRHNKSASLFDYEGDAFVDDKADPFENLMREKQREQLDAAIASLTDCQRELFEAYFVDGKKVEMTPKEYELLFYLVENNGIAISREKLLSNVWGYDFYGDDRTVDTHIKMLRSSLGKYRDKIITLRGLGYKIEL